MDTNIEVGLQYIRALESGATGDALAKFFTSDAFKREMPSRIAPHGSVSNLAKALEGAKRGQDLFKRQTYTIINIMGEGDRVALEMEWMGVTAVQFESIPPNSEMRNHVAVFLEFRNARIAVQRHYDCFEPW
jgi:predicted ester cyclase